MVGYKDLDDLKARVAPHAFFADKALLNLPPKVYLPPRHAEMLPAQARAYEEMRLYSMTEIGRQLELRFDALSTDSGQGENVDITFDDLKKSSVAEPDKVPVASADIVLTQLLRLQQIACGFVKTEDGVEVDLCDGKNPRVAEILEMIEDAGPSHKFIIWAPFTRSLHELQAALTAAYGADSVVVYAGETSSEDREAAKVQFMDMAGPVHFFLGSQSTGGRGLTLTAADYVFYYADVFHNELRANSEDRAHRLGTDHSVLYQNVACAPVDAKISAALAAKKNVSDLLREGSWKELFS